MPDLNTFKLEGTKLVPTNRFNLEPAKPSNSFATVVKPKETFTVIEHPIIHSIAIDRPFLDIFQLNKYFPLIDGDTAIDENASFKAYSDNTITLFFPEIEIAPNNDTLFYYENVLDKSGKNSGLLGRVTLKYTIKNKQLKADEKNIVLSLKEAILNLKVKDDSVKINGIVMPEKNEIQFDLKDEAVKIAFLNLITKIENLKSNIDLFFEFKGYSKFRKNFLVARNIGSLKNLKFFGNETRTESIRPTKASILSNPLIIKSDSPKSMVSRRSILEIQKENHLDTNVQTELVKSTFLLRVNKSLNYPLSSDPATSLYKTIGGGFINNPFNLNEDFSQFKQIFIPGIHFSKLSVYKSTLQPNTFLLISKTYGLSRDLDTMKPCISTIFHAYEDGTSTQEEISKISFQFALGPNLSEFDLAKLKIELLQNNYIDGDKTDYFEKVQFLFPNDIGSDYEISGNYFLQESDISTDGKHFLFNLSTENLSEASILINALNNTISQFANINFRHKEIKDTSIIELNLEKTIGEMIESVIDNTSKTIKISNKSISKCRLNSILFVNNENASYFNSTYFNKFPDLISSESKVLDSVALNPNNKSSVVKNIFFDFESIEDISSEFSQIVSQSTSYSRYIQIEIKKQKQTTAKITLELVVEETGNRFTIEKLKAEFSTPILFNFIVKNSITSNTLLSYKVNYFDKNDNLVKTQNHVFDYSTSSKITINQ
ncbi:hypothetical protein [Flavobacterium microcysteis]|uniref:Uncharacterized protein n=1 Tax=Flavobacterium microcysteis TaxID=2596891 RepID=A0A501QFB9_9FLAO|nr:hypothetical protein [Flavobacterium microcysteis]TPD71313.1 hypothetical protein FJA49_05280 [Flavobacterium microcysteis]